jgi:hypothetical protein
MEVHPVLTGWQEATSPGICRMGWQAQPHYRVIRNYYLRFLDLQ